MQPSASPFPLPETLEPELARVHAYWRSLLRGSAEMPFWDDYNPKALADLAPRLMLIDVFELPERFRFGSLGEDIARPQKVELLGKFADMVHLEPPLDFLRAQCSATVESAAPTWFSRRGGENRPAGGYSRLLLPMWGDGRIGMILGAVA